MSKSEERLCPRCGEKMISGYLKAGIDSIYVKSFQSKLESTLEALICPACGVVELQAGSPKNLSYHDISDTELKNILGK